MDDKNFKERVPSLDRINHTNQNLTRGGFNDAKEGEDDSRSWFDEQGGARRRHVDGIKPEDQTDG